MVLALILLLRKPIADLILLLTRLKYKDLELEFGRRLAEVTAEAGEELPPPHPPAPLEAAEEQTLVELAKVSPRSAVTEAWRRSKSPRSKQHGEMTSLCRHMTRHLRPVFCARLNGIA